MGRQDDNRKAWMNPQQFFRHIQSVFVSKPEIGNGKVKPVILGYGEGFMPGGATCDGKAHSGQSHLHKM